MKDRDRVGLGFAIVSIAAGFAVGVATGRVAAQLVEDDIARVAKSASARHVVELGALRHEPTTHGVARFKVPVTRSQPSVGPSDALVTIVEWCELYGERCRGSDRLITAALESRPLEVRRVFRHMGQGGAAADDARVLSRVAHEHGKFWELRRALSKRDRAPRRAELKCDAGTVGIDWDDAERAFERQLHVGELAADRSFAERFDVNQAPAIFVNGRRMDGEMSAKALNATIEKELEHAKRMLHSGAPRERIYAEIIKQGEQQVVRLSAL